MKLNRRTMRGSRLLPMCRNARIDRWESDNGIYYYYCFGKYDASNDEPLEECKQCRAWNQQDDYSLYWEQ